MIEPAVPAHDDIEPDHQQADHSLASARLRNATLAGATESITFANEHDLRLAVMTLMTCDAHQGLHHFAIGGVGTLEARTLWASRSGFECINAAELGFTIPGYVVPEKAETPPAAPFHDPSAATPRERCPKCGGVEIAPYKYDHSTDCPSN